MFSQIGRQFLVSIVVPFFHTYAEYLGDCLESVRRQSYGNLEVILVDDASPGPEARDIVARFGDPRITLISHDRNRGQAAARNTGIRASRGEYFMPLDCDDMIGPCHVENLMKTLETNPGANVAYADYHLFASIDREVQFPLRDTRTLLREQWIPHPGTIFHRSLWERAQGYCEDDVFRSGNEDWEFFLRLVEVGMCAVRVPDASYHYRQHATSITTSRFTVQDYVTREAMYLRHQRLFDLFGMKNVFLAGGYRVSGIAMWRSGQRISGLKLLARAARLCPFDMLSVPVQKTRRLVAHAWAGSPIKKGSAETEPSINGRLS
jgi:glycosyltransferase involved in cell wall biosynthesis